MQIKLRNFGPIKAFDFELEKDWVVIFGQNNIGKSYGIYMVYLLIKTLLTVQRQCCTGTLIDSERLQQVFLAEFQQAFSATFDKVDNTTSRLSQQPMTLSISTDVAELILETQNKKWIFNNSTLLKQIQSDFSLDAVQQVYYLPAARFGIYQALSAFAAIFAELSKSRSILTQKVEIPTLSDPVSDYFLGLSQIKNSRTPGDKAILRIVEEIEQTILKGEVIFDTFLKKIFYKPYHTDLVLELSLTSSMVSELAPIVCYLKYIVAFAESKSLLFIEEPEAHLHPKAQIQLMGLLAKLVKTNVKLVMACHSNYMFNQMNNLILDGTIDSASTQAIVFKETNQGSQAIDMPMNRLGIDDENFVDTAEAIFNRKLEIIEKLNEAA